MAQFLVWLHLVGVEGLRLVTMERRKPPSCVHVVVAAYNEDLSWIDLMLPQIPNADLKLYCAADSQSDSRCMPVENLKSEIPTFLKHIIDNYDAGLAPITVFAMGSSGKPEWDFLLCRKLNYAMSYLNTTEKQKHFPGFVTMAHQKPSDLLNFDPKFDITNYRNSGSDRKTFQQCRPSVAPLGAWYQQFINSDVQRAIEIGTSFNSIFAVSAERIRKYPKAVYEGIYDELYKCKGDRATAGHYMERLWKPMFDTNPPHSKVSLEAGEAGPNFCPIIRKLKNDVAAKFNKAEYDPEEWYSTAPSAEHEH